MSHNTLIVSLTTELAHNLESAHNASHEFYFSSISEEFLVPFMSLIQSKNFEEFDEVF